MAVRHPNRHILMDRRAKKFKFDENVIPSGLEMKSVAAEHLNDEKFSEKWAKTNLLGTFLYFQDALERWPSRHAKVIKIMSHAQPGGILFHYARGQDRTGITAIDDIGIIECISR